MPLPLTISWAVKSRLVLPFWYRLTWGVPDKGPLNGGVCCLTYVSWNILHFVFSLPLGIINCHAVWSMVDRIVCYENYAPRHTTTWMFSIYSVQQQHLQLVNPKNGTMWYVTCEVWHTTLYLVCNKKISLHWREISACNLSICHAEVVEMSRYLSPGALCSSEPSVPALTNELEPYVTVSWHVAVKR